MCNLPREGQDYAALPYHVTFTTQVQRSQPQVSIPALSGCQSSPPARSRAWATKGSDWVLHQHHPMAHSA